jgi:uncharacterized protein (TIGR02145 family)/uncharacterized repeat protein (TIGR02059 family)
LVDLDPGTKYYINTYISNDKETSYGKEISFETFELPIPIFVSSIIENATPSVLEMTYSLSLANIIPATSTFTIMVNSVSRAVNAVSISGTKVSLTLASQVNYGDVVTVAYTKPVTNPLQTSSGGQATSISAQNVTNNVASIPVFVSSVIENAKPSVLEMTYSLSLANIIPATSTFTIMVNSVSRAVNAVSISGTKVLLTLASQVNYGDVVTVAYNKPVTNPLQTSYGGQATSISAQNVTNNVASIPVYVGSVIENATPALLEMTYNLTLANIVPATSAFTVIVNSVSRSVISVSVSGTKVQLTLSSAVNNGDVVTVAYTRPGSNPLQTPSGGQAASISAMGVTNNVASIPVYVSSVIENATPALLAMTYNMTLANVIPATSAFTVMVNSVQRTVNNVAISGTKVQLTLASAVVYGDVVTVAYTKPGTNQLQTPSGGQAVSISARSVTNNVLPEVPVYISSVIEDVTPVLLEMTYNLTLANVVPATSAFTVMVNSVLRPVNNVAISGTKVQLTLASAVVYGDVVTVAYTKPGTNPLQTPSGGQAASITAKTVTNNVFTLGTVTDIDGNVYYTIIIGGQTWMKENLKTTRYNDGTDIIYTPAGDNTGNYCWYNDEITNKDIYGALYTKTAVYSGKLCPTGWHVPSYDGEWLILKNYLTDNGYGYEGSGDDIAKSLASGFGWVESSTAGTVGYNQSENNSSGFTIVPAGWRFAHTPYYYDAGYYTRLWTSSYYIGTDPAIMGLMNTSSAFNVEHWNDPGGCFSVRCVKD